MITVEQDYSLYHAPKKAKNISHFKTDAQNNDYKKETLLVEWTDYKEKSNLS
jgi:hypothetical protein